MSEVPLYETVAKQALASVRDEHSEVLTSSSSVLLSSLELIDTKVYEP